MIRIIGCWVLMVFSVVAIAEEATISEAKKAEVATLANQLCDTILLYKNMGRRSVHVAFERGVLYFLNINPKETPNYRAEISNFWNQYNEYMICTNESVGFESPQHLLKRVVDMGSVTSFYYEYFLQDESVNLNAIEWVEDEPETLIDYLDKSLADPQSKGIYDLETVRQLRSFVVSRINGKRACELLEEYDCKARYDELIENAHIDPFDTPCTNMARAKQNNESVILAFESTILDILDIPAEDNEYYDAVISKFWNKYRNYSDRFDCEDPRQSQGL